MREGMSNLEEVAGMFEPSQLHRAANFHVNEFGEIKIKWKFCNTRKTHKNVISFPVFLIGENMFTYN